MRINSPNLNTIYPVSLFGGPNAFYDLTKRQIVIIDADPDTGAQSVYDIIPEPYDPSITDYSAFICVGLITDHHPFQLAN